MIHKAKLYSLDGKLCVLSKPDLKEQECLFDLGTSVPSFSMSYQGYMYYSINNKLYNSCKRPSLIREFDSKIVGMFRDSSNKMILATSEHGFFINDQNQIKSLYLPGTGNLQNINSAIYCDERIIYNRGSDIYSWSQDDLLEIKIHSAQTNDILLAEDRFNQLWISDGGFLHKINRYQDLTNLSIDLKNLVSNSTETSLHWIAVNSPQLFPDLSFEYKIENKEWQSLNDQLLSLDIESGHSNISVRAYSPHGKSNVFNFIIEQAISDPIIDLMKSSIVIMGILVFGLLLLLWRQLYLKKISDQNITRLRTQRALVKTNDKLFELQMNPHFIFNCLNAIKGLVAIDKPKEARKAISDFASIMRSLLDYSRDEQNSIKEEVRFLKKYLELQEITYPNVFTYDIVVDEDIDQSINIPVMMIQPFVENAVLHGLVPKKEMGKLDIRFTISSKLLTCIVTDNGVGIKNHLSSPHLSHSTSIINNRISNAKLKSSLTISNLMDAEGNSTGTQIIIPLIRIKE